MCTLTHIPEALLRDSTMGQIRSFVQSLFRSHVSTLCFSASGFLVKGTEPELCSDGYAR